MFAKVITLTSGGTPPTKNTMSLGSTSNSESVPGASPFWMNFCSSVELWLGMVRKTFPCRPSLKTKRTKEYELSQSCYHNLVYTPRGTFKLYFITTTEVMFSGPVCVCLLVCQQYYLKTTSLILMKHGGWVKHFC